MIFNLQYYGDKDDFEKFVLIYALGVIEALNKELITIDEAENLLFRPGTEDCFKELKLDKRIQNIVNKGCFLEDCETFESLDFTKEKKEIYIRILKTLEDINKKLEKDEPKFTVFSFTGGLDWIDKENPELLNEDDDIE